MNKVIKITTILLSFVVLSISCKKSFLDINTDPDRIKFGPIANVLTSAQVNVGFTGGSDLYRYAALISQQLSGQTTGATTQTQDYERYNIAGSDENNLWSSMYATTLSDLEYVIKTAGTTSPNYSGVAKILKAYTYQTMVDTWGNIPFSDALQNDLNTSPRYDNADAVYTGIIKLLDEGIAEVTTTSSVLSPGSTSTIYPAASFATARPNWIKLANTLKLRMYIHYSKKDPAFCVAQITALVNNTSNTFMGSNADNFQMSFFNVANNRNPIDAFEINRANYLFANDKLVSLMNTRIDPRRAFYFTAFPYTSSPALYKGAKGGDVSSVNYSRLHTYLRGAVSGTAIVNGAGGVTGGLTYTGAAPIKMLTYAEYCFIRSEAALMGAPGVAQTWYVNGITASMQDAGVAATDITAYLLTPNATLAGTNAQKLQQIIEEKFIANYGVVLEPWTDWRRTGYPAIAPPVNALYPAVPRSLFYPQSEIDLNPNCPGQKADMQARIFWDTP